MVTTYQNDRDNWRENIDHIITGRQVSSKYEYRGVFPWGILKQSMIQRCQNHLSCRASPVKFPPLLLCVPTVGDFCNVFSNNSIDNTRKRENTKASSYTIQWSHRTNSFIVFDSLEVHYYYFYSYFSLVWIEKQTRSFIAYLMTHPVCWYLSK